ncbi:hypothetical protein A3768_5651 (plasmid) [Ralstonia solanacearum]|nr:hypothetical protein F504_3792 [Ralstonia pseudosolanacearum FQY_4]ANH36427.1 hypothetical protein A3768_5651 [Ralstonia solanacearum]
MQTHPHTLTGLFSASSICKDEVFAGFVARHRLAALDSPAAQLLGGPNRSLSWLMPTRLAEIVPAWGDCLGSLESVLANNTLLPGFNRFLSPQHIELVHRHHTGANIAGLISVLGLTSLGSRRVVHHTWGPGICLDCLKEDITPTGDCFWRRDLVLQHVRLCPRHGTPVYDLCGTCFHGIRGSTVLRVPLSTCVCGTPLKPRERIRHRAMEQLELELARGWSRLLDSNFAPHAQGQLIAAVACHKARELGVVKNRGVKWQRFAQIFMNPTFGKLGDSLGFPFKCRRVAKFLLGDTSLRNPLHGLFILLALFEKWETIESVLRTTTTAPDISMAAPIWPGQKTSAAWKVRALAQSIKLLPQTCELYESLRSTHPYLAHTHIVALMPHQNARAATRERLRAHGVQFPEEDFSLVQDMSAAAHIEQQAQLLTKAGVTYRLTKSRLLYGHPMRYTWKFEHVRARSPKTAAALEKYVETPAQLCRRRLPEQIRAGLVPNWGPEEVQRLDDLTDQEVLALWQRHRQFRWKSCRS